MIFCGNFDIILFFYISSLIYLLNKYGIFVLNFLRKAFLLGEIREKHKDVEITLISSSEKLDSPQVNCTSILDLVDLTI